MFSNIKKKWISIFLLSLSTLIGVGYATEKHFGDEPTGSCRGTPPSTLVSQVGDFIRIGARRLVSDAEHTQFLKETLATATSKVMISTYDVSPKRLFGEELGQAIISASKRGVAVYVYYENRPWYSKEDYADLGMVASYCAKFEENANHSKCVIKDECAVAIGSHNWLSEAREGSSNGSLVITGGLAHTLIGNVWQGIRFYQSLKYGNVRGEENFLRDKSVFSTEEYQFEPGQFFYNLRTPEAHGIFLSEVLEKAKARVLIFSPFIRLQKLCTIFSPQVLGKLMQKGVTIKLITSPSPCDRVPEEQKYIFSKLKDLCSLYPNFSYMSYLNFHAKTLIADDLICEGSFNWLSAVTQLDHDANNFEMSIALRGNMARELIQSFERTELGKSVLAMQGPSSFIPTSFDRVVKVFSGEQFGIRGYCVRFNGGDYLRDERGKILYFETPESATQAAYTIWKK